MVWHYTGDLNIEHGGAFYSLENWDWGYAEYVRCTPCSDAGAADNCYWVDKGTVNFNFDKPEWVEDKFKSALDCCGMIIEEWRNLSEAAQHHTAFECLLSYGAYEKEDEILVELGQYWYGEKIAGAKKLRGNTDLRKYVRRICTKGFKP